MNTKSIGDIGEEQAAEYLKSIGYRIIYRNVHIAGGEIDIVAADEDTMVFVEVKARATKKFGEPVESITPAKVKVLIRAIRSFIHKYRLYGKAVRIDVISVLDGNIEHIKDAIWYN